jgi:hypothetical protein
VVSGAEEALVDGNKTFRSLVTLQSVVSLLENVFPNIGYSQSRGVVTAVLQALNGEEGTATLIELGCLGRVCVWENALLKKSLHSDVAEELLAASSSQTEEGTSQAADDNQAPAAAPAATQGSSSSTGGPETPVTTKALDPNSPKARNAKALRHILGTTATSVQNFFAGKLFLSPKYGQPFLTRAPSKASYLVRHRGDHLTQAIRRRLLRRART